MANLKNGHRSCSATTYFLVQEKIANGTNHVYMMLRGATLTKIAIKNSKSLALDSFDDILRGGDLGENSDFKNLRFENMLSNFRTVSTSFL